MDDFVKRVMELRIGVKYQILRRLASGGGRKVYLGRNVDSNEQVAIKLDDDDSYASQVATEADIYESLAGRPGFARLYWYGQESVFRVLVLELLGPSLEDLFQYCGQRFSLKTTLMLADQLLHRLEIFHGLNFLHCDIKPSNFLLGSGRQGNTVYMTDFGLTRYWWPRSEDPSRSPACSPILIGTSRFASLKAHLGIGLRRCDDLEALGYMLIYFLRGSLPWQELQAVDSQTKHHRVWEMKKTISAAELCGDLPGEFADYVTYLRELPDRDQPGYAYLRKKFRALFRRRGFEYDHVYDWTILEFQRQKQREKHDSR